jgi:predicted transcriptional regulator
VSTTSRFPEDVHARLGAVAKERRRSRNQAVVVAVERSLRQTTARPPEDDPDGR